MQLQQLSFALYTLSITSKSTYNGSKNSYHVGKNRSEGRTSISGRLVSCSGFEVIPRRRYLARGYVDPSPAYLLT